MECGGAVWSVVVQWLGQWAWNLRVGSSNLTGSPHKRPWASCLPKVGLGSLSRKMSTWLRTVFTLCAPGKIVW